MSRYSSIVFMLPKDSDGERKKEKKTDNWIRETGGTVDLFPIARLINQVKHSYYNCLELFLMKWLIPTVNCCTKTPLLSYAKNNWLRLPTCTHYGGVGREKPLLEWQFWYSQFKKTTSKFTFTHNSHIV